MMFAGEYSPDFYRALHKLTHKKFRLWQGIDTLKSAMVHPSRISKQSIRRIAASAYHAMTIPRVQEQVEALQGGKE
ncbi:MAG TPA: hypothetical protein VKS81_04625, partial [Bacteroidota bacterium]|nr:hypothetical protein [Bacteroidota bacterium]